MSSTQNVITSCLRPEGQANLRHAVGGMWRDGGRGESGRPTYGVNCDFGQSIQEAVDKANDVRTINVYGTCTEELKLPTSRLSIHLHKIRVISLFQ